MNLYILIPIAYLLGSIPTGVIVARAFGANDPRNAGSKNIGATNVGRTAGKLAGVITLIGDLLKGAAPVLAAASLTNDVRLISLVGFSAFIGHLFPVFLGFRGGKGVATACGVMLVVAPVATLLSGAVFVAAVLVKKYVSLGSMLAAASLPVFLSFIPGSKPFVPMGAVLGALVIIKHKENIKRLAEGRENRFK